MAFASHSASAVCRLGKYFYVSLAACPNDLNVLLAGSGVSGNSDLGELLLLKPDPCVDPPALGGDPKTDLLVATLVQ